MENFDSFTIAVVGGVLVVLGIMVILIAVDKGLPPPADTSKRRKTPRS